MFFLWVASDASRDTLWVTFNTRSLHSSSLRTKTSLNMPVRGRRLQSRLSGSDQFGMIDLIWVA
jgi:hypothetical protein